MLPTISPKLNTIQYNLILNSYDESNKNVHHMYMKTLHETWKKIVLSDINKINLPVILSFYSFGVHMKFFLLTYLSGATTALRSWPASGVSETAHGLAPLSASPLSRP